MCNWREVSESRVLDVLADLQAATEQDVLRKLAEQNALVLVFGQAPSVGSFLRSIERDGFVTCDASGRFSLTEEGLALRDELHAVVQRKSA